MTDTKEYIFKVIVLGDGAVGKTSLVLQFTEKKFDDNYIMSIGANFSIKIMNMPERDLFIRLQIWDLAGQQNFDFVRPSFYRGAFISTYVFDLTNRESFEHIRKWVEEASQYVETPMVLVGNKVDLIEDRVVSKKEGEALANELGALGYYETSAKTGVNVKKMFEDITEELIQKNLSK